LSTHFFHVQTIAAPQIEVRFAADIFSRQGIGSRILGSVEIVENPARALLDRGLDERRGAADRYLNLDIPSG